MRRLLSIILMLGFVAFAATSWAQSRVVTGTVTDDNGDPVIGATVRAQDTDIGVISGIDGGFSINVPDGVDNLVVSFVGMETKTLPITGTNVTVTLVEDALMLEGVVVTATGTRNEDRLNYDVQAIDAESVNQAPVTDISDALAGKVSGMQVLGSSGITFNESATRLRGINGGIGGGSPIYVVDGVIVPNQNSIDPATVQSISVLKGANATALYGVRATNGAIIVTTKRGSEKGKFNISSSASISDVSTYFDYQTEYGGGYEQNFTPFSYNPQIHPASWAAFDGHLMPEYYADESWGPRLDGTMVRHWESWIPNSPTFGQLRPWSGSQTPRNFFDVAPTFDNTVSFSKGGDDYNVLVSYRNNTRNGLLPNTSQDRNYITLNTEFDVKSNLKLSASGRYNTVNTHNDPAEGYGNIGSNLSQWWQMQLNFDRLRELAFNPDGTTNSWNINGPTDTQPLYWDNPYFSSDKLDNNQKNNRVIGRLALDFEPVENLVITPSVSLYHNEYKSSSITPTGGLNQDSFGTSSSQSDELTYQLKGSYFHEFSPKVDLEVTAVGELYDLKYSRISQSTTGGLTIPGFYAITGETDANVGQGYDRKRVESMYGFVNLGLFGHLVFLEGAIRSDWTSTLSNENNPIITPSGGISFLFGDLIESNILSHGKLRYSYADRLQDIGTFLTSQNYTIGTPYGAQATLFVPGTLNNPDLVGATIPSHEAGISLGFFNNRLNIDASYFNYLNKDFVFQLDAPATSGYGSFATNAGEIETTGYEIAVSGQPIKSDDWNLELNANIGHASSVVNELTEGINNFRFASFAFRGTPPLSVSARKGEKWGAIYGRKRTFDDQGRPYLTTSGAWVMENEGYLGSAIPDLIGGLSGNLNWKNFDFFFSSDFRFGGQFFSISKMFNSYSGLGSNTVGNNQLGNPLRDPVLNASGSAVAVVAADQAHPDSGGVLMTGVDPNSGQEVAYYRDAVSYFGSYFRSFWVNDRWTYDADYLKLRTLRLNYTFPQTFFDKAKLGMSNASIGLYADNVSLLWSKAGGDIDPSEIENYNSGGYNISWLDGGQFPSARTMGINLKMGF